MNPLFNRFNKPQDLISLIFGNIQNFQQQFNAIASQFPNQIGPQQSVQQLLASGRMTQQQFEQYSQIADTILGRRK